MAHPILDIFLKKIFSLKHTLNLKDGSIAHRFGYPRIPDRIGTGVGTFFFLPMGTPNPIPANLVGAGGFYISHAGNP